MGNKYMLRAIELAELSIKQGGGPFAAVIVKGDSIIGEGFNQVSLHNDPTAHAEMVAIRNACQNISHFQLLDAVLYCTGEPCPMCLSAIYWARLKCIYYANSYQQAQLAGFDDQFIYNELSLPDEKKSIPVSRITSKELLEKANNIYRLWDSKSDKIKY